MAYDVISIASSATGTYGIANECVGQLVAQLLAANPALVLISDNNPLSTVRRVVDLKMGANMHYLQVYTSSSTLIVTAIRNIANTATLTVTGVNYIAPQLSITTNTATFHLLSGPNTLVIIDPTTTTTSTKAIGFVKGADANWYALSLNDYPSAGVASSSTVDDTTYILSSLTNIHTGVDGTIPLINVYVSDSTYALTTLNPVYMPGSLDLVSRSVYAAGAVTYCCFIGTNLGSLLIGDN